ncbi:C-X-C chemokine receptor type 5-like [Megalops cyprinoides]|uniref:C-X-C chemokine receptor type 5-like n=1 Tax=Megalops cyprinoides TaxID=118141 RepID=UPI00186512FB|nr:C-X-C chemokine receptor type 5-like [Megalops cyprinoides]
MAITESIILEFPYVEGSSDYDNMTEGPQISECNKDLQLFHKMFQPVVYGVVLLVGLLGNGLLMAVLLRRLGSLRVTEIYLLHLALADLLLLFTFPFTLSQSMVGWVFGSFMCKAVGLLSFLNFLCGSLLLAFISFDRYLAIVRAVESMRARRPRGVHFTCASMWLLSLCLSAPNAVFMSVDTEHIANTTVTYCYFFSHGLHSNNWNLARRFITHLCFFLPLALMTYCYSAVVFTLCRTTRSRDKQGAIRLAMLITVVFCLSWLPYNLALLVNTLVDLDIISLSCESLAQLERATVVTESIGYSHCCINPLLYAFVGVRFRQDLLRLLGHWGCRWTPCLRAMRGERASNASFSEGAGTTNSSLI